MVGKLYGVGIGPGDPELVTPKALRILNSVDIVFAPKSTDAGESVALSVVRDLLEDPRVIYLDFPMTKDEDILERSWTEVIEKVYEELKKGLDAAFPTIGDPLFYSTFVHVMGKMQEIHPEVEMDVTPGVTSLSACMGELKIPLGERDERIAVIPASYGLEDLDALTKFDTIILMKVSRNFDEIVAKLDKLGLMDKSIFVSKCGKKGFFSSPLNEMIGKEIDYFSMIIVRCNA